MLRDNYIVRLKLKSYSFLKRDRVIILNIEEASIEKTLEFLEIMEKVDFKIIELIYNIFRKASNGKINKKIFKKYIGNNLETILEILKKTYIKWVYEENIQEKITEETPKKLDKDDFLKDFGRLLAFLTNKMSIDPNNLLKTYTRRQIRFWIKHYLYIERAKTEGGQKENKKQDSKDYNTKHKKQIEASLSVIDKYLNKKNNT